MQSLGGINGQSTRSIAFGVNADGSVVVGRAEQPDNVQAFRWTSGSGMLGAGSKTSEFNAVTADGSIAAGRFNSAPPAALEVPLAATWTQGSGWHALSGALPDSNAFGISDDGSVVVGVNQNHAFRWTSVGGLVDIGPTGQVPTHSIARDVSADGSVVVGDGGEGEDARPFRWTAAGGLEVIQTDQTAFAFATNGDGSVIVGQLGFQSPFIWDQANGVRNLQTLLANNGANVHGWTDMRPFGISADGKTVVGDARNPSGNTEAWIATLPGSPTAIPLPSALPAGAALLLLLGLCKFARVRRGGHAVESLRWSRRSA
jgi:probable HAF family extracellular repeat protein